MTSLLLTPIAPRTSAAEACAAALRALIVSGQVGEGERLPPERALAEQLGVNRSTLRAGLRELESAGLLRVRQGSGYVVRSWRESAGPALVPELVRVARVQGELLALSAELLDVRRRLAAAVAERLAELEPAGVELAELEARIDELDALAKRSPSPSAAELAGADLGVVHALVRASRSPVLGLFLNPVLDVLASLPELCAAIYAEPEQNVAAYRALIVALRTGESDPSMVGALLVARDRETLRRLEASLGERRSPAQATSEGAPP